MEIVFVETVVTGVHVKKLRDELTRALVEASQGEDGGRIETTSPASFNQLVEDMTSNGHDIKAFAFKTKAMVLQTLYSHFLTSFFLLVFSPTTRLGKVALLSVIKSAKSRSIPKNTSGCGSGSASCTKLNVT